MQISGVRRQVRFILTCKQRIVMKYNNWEILYILPSNGHGCECICRCDCGATSAGCWVQESELDNWTEIEEPEEAKAV